jgi:hypothetical protein
MEIGGSFPPDSSANSYLETGKILGEVLLLEQKIRNVYRGAGQEPPELLDLSKDLSQIGYEDLEATHEHLEGLLELLQASKDKQETARDQFEMEY